MFRFRTIPFHQVRIRDTFWTERLRVNHEQSLPKQYDMCKRTGRIDALRLEWKPGSSLPKPHVFWDSDTAKWLEAACYACHIQPDDALRAKIDEVAALFVVAQQPDGYLNSRFTTVRPQDRWKCLRSDHELYCAGHIIEAAVAHHGLTDTDLMLDVARRLSDCIGRAFGTGPGQIRGYCGHEEIELALVRLYHATGERRHLDLASYFIDERGRQPLWFALEDPSECNLKAYKPEQYQVHRPVREQTEAVGHAVRAMYLYTGMIDVGAATNDPALLEACHRLWHSVARRKLYLTGGIGSTWAGEAFTGDFDLPNERAYCETCASVALVFWARRMLQLEGDSQYAEVLERALFNGVLSGMSLDGRKFFYQNPLISLGQHTRKEWFNCSCCPSNLSRLLASLGDNLASHDDDILLLHLYVGADIPFTLASGAAGTARLSGDLPWGNAAKLELKLDREAEVAWELRLRMPSWAENFRLQVNGEAATVRHERGYACLRRAWRNGDTVNITFDTPIRQLVADPRITTDSGHVALQRGPFVYCIEDADFKDDGGVLPVALSREDGDSLKAHYRADLLDGIVIIEGSVHTAADDSDDATRPLYRSAAELRSKPVAFRAIPYFAWDNRGTGAMRVWIPRQSG